MGINIIYIYKCDIEKYESNSFDIENYNDIKYLECFKCNLINLPILPNSLNYLNCESNKLINLPVLPNSLNNLNCENNKLINLPILPDCLEYLYCCINKLINLPILPDCLKYLYCYRNKLIRLTKINKQNVTLMFDINIIKFIDKCNLYLIKINYFIKF